MSGIGKWSVKFTEKFSKCKYSLGFTSIYVNNWKPTTTTILDMIHRGGKDGGEREKERLPVKNV